MPRVERKLTTIVVADVVGFSKLMGEDEAATLDALMACRSIIDQIIAEHHGRVFGSAGDSVAECATSGASATGRPRSSSTTSISRRSCIRAFGGVLGNGASGLRRGTTSAGASSDGPSSG